MKIDRSKLTFWFLFAVTLLVLILESRSLFVAPAFDSSRWSSDETWLLSEGRHQMEHGYVRAPLARASTLEEPKGVLLGSPWIRSALYGIPQIVVGKGVSMHAVGRIVTLLLSLGLLWALYGVLRGWSFSKSGAMAGVLILTTTESFFITSHSARPDILAALLLLAVVGYLSRHLEGERSRGWWFYFGASYPLIALTASIHLAILGVLIYLLFALFKWGKWKLSDLASAVAGAALSLLALIALHGAFTGDWLQLPTQGRDVGDISRDIPILKPFSLSVQWSNFSRKMLLFLDEAILVLGVWIVVLVANYFGKPLPLKRTDRFVLLSALVLFLAWMFLERQHPNYLIHILPVLICAIAVAFKRRFPEEKDYAALTAVAFVGMGTSAAYRTGTTISEQNREAVETLAREIGSARVVVESSALANATTLLPNVMTDQFLFFPREEGTVSQVVHREGVEYILLLNSPLYPGGSRSDDALYRFAAEECDRVDSRSGYLYDYGRGYFQELSGIDTLILYRVRDR